MLVVTADDLGYSEPVDRGIMRAHRDGIVRSTSLLVTFPRSAEAAELARAEPALEIG
ncbi:MAG: ChbG/HpnK family deacetylase, partial [Chloroflexi bacterium]|nr:ChbG/HpnK family deacetylase [Chloroflexota bacterium]